MNKAKRNIESEEGHAQTGVPPVGIGSDLAALEQEFVPLMPVLYGAATRILRNPYDSEDALQDGLLLAIRHLDQFRGQSSMSTWLYTIVRNAALTQLRNRSGTTPVAQAADAADVRGNAKPSPEEECSRAEHSQILMRSLSQLPLKYQVVVRLCVIEELLLREAASKLGVSIGTIQSRLHRARRLLIKQVRVNMGTCCDARRRSYPKNNLA